jgi:predicted Zn-dependent protease
MSESSGDQCATLADVGGPRNRAPLDLLERCTRLYPDDAELAGDLALSLEERNDPRATAAYRRALSIDPSHADLRLRLGQLLLRQGDAAGAAAEAQAGLRVQPNRRALVDLLQSARNLVTGDGL